MAWHEIFFKNSNFDYEKKKCLILATYAEPRYPKKILFDFKMSEIHTFETYILL